MIYVLLLLKNLIVPNTENNCFIKTKQIIDTCLSEHRNEVEKIFSNQDVLENQKESYHL